ncbi:hypothetical protein ACRDNQ_15040 [Palleronia sp. KMU-117]|uniref:hypothetical protein n=1 Tax=Palleronia sp. KMU-117 TaxID=3434108 RepID=UPI003D719ED5
MRRSLAIIALALAMPSQTVAQAGSEDALERARAVDACAGRPVLSAEYAEGGRLNVTCGEGDGGGGGLSAGGGGAILGVLLLLGLAAGGGGGSSDATN